MSSTEQTITQRLGVMRPDSIRSKILMFAVAATLLPSFTTAWISYTENKRSLTAKASEELLSASTQAARELDLWIKERRYDLRVFASSYEVTENLERIPRVAGESVRSGRAYQRLSDYLNSVRERFADYEELLILDPHGHVVASSGEQLRAPVLPRDWLAQVRGGDLVIGAPFWDRATNHPEMLIAVPIAVAGDPFLGALTAKMNLRAVAQTLRRFAPGDAGQVYLMTEDGSPIVSSRESSAALMALRYPTAAARSHLARDEQPVEFTNVTGEQVVGSVRRVPGLNWIVVAEIPTAEVFLELARLRNVTLLIVTAMLAVAGALGYALGLFIVRPLDRLTRGVANVAAGDLDVDLPVATGGEVGYLTKVFNNMVAHLRTSQRELERLSVTDHLTGLYNRRRMREVLENEVRRSRRLKHTFAVLMGDVDHFKKYNDANGHPAGDAVLKRVASILQEASRDVDFVARYGGEEFFVLMPETDAGGAAEVAQRVRERLAKEPLPAGAVTLSFGVAEFPAHGDTGESVISAADAVLYQAKREGRDQVVVAAFAGRARVAGR
ncbi:MAG: sensor domain-containing diguanylate cyclase [Steroidobacteraceae bacterium]